MTDPRTPGPVPAGPLEATRRMFAQTFDYSGRASRSEFWWPTLIFGAAAVACDLAARHYDKVKHPEAYTRPSKLMTIYPLVDSPQPGEEETPEQKAARKKHLKRAELTALAASAPLMLAVSAPSMSLWVRRMHDINLSGHWLWLNAVPVLGGVGTLAACVLPSNPKGARFDR
ncbi:DUF805 domain-containing protein [Rothia nasimurium]|uniref:DUF805 domain-containing protein n=1 Tax=Rothia nasimurium TaxID=85336 RepID=UPI001F33E7AD|nr:DUF805 domain-containing protein [Rothia nasimurium]